MSDDRSNLLSAIEGLARARIVCAGDIMVDRFERGEVTRISPEAPVPVCRILSSDTMLGGAGNVARNLSALGASTHLVGVVGKDAIADELRALCAQLPGTRASLSASGDRPTTLKVRYAAQAHQLLRVDHEFSGPVPDTVAGHMLEALEDALDADSVLLLSDYAKGALPPALIERAIAMASGRGARILVDPKGRDFTRYRGASLLTPNEHELKTATGMPTERDEEVEAAAHAVLDSCGVEELLCTRGARGMSLISRERTLHLPTDAKEVFDVSGAGDTVVAVLAAAIATGQPTALAARLANLAGSIVVSKAGTAVVRREELAQAAGASATGTGTAYAELPAARDKIESWRQAGKRVGFTNGCFDLLHPGHISLLRQAKSACDRLVVGLNSDASVRQLKGPERPIQPQSARATVLASLNQVDLVVIFDEETPEELIHALRPDVLVKGADYRIEDVVGAEFVQSYGGEVLLAELQQGHSTTATVARMAG